MRLTAWLIRLLFQSTLPAKGATSTSIASMPNDFFQSTLPAKGATRACKALPLDDNLSIHAPREGSDTSTLSHQYVRYTFNPRSPRRERRLPRLPPLRRHPFNPRSPRRERLTKALDSLGGYNFQSTLPAKGATGAFLLDSITRELSIHAPREGSDYEHLHGWLDCVSFNPRSPRRERHPLIVCNHLFEPFNPRSPRRERP